MRSNVFRFLLFLLIVCVILVPNTIKGDGTAYGYIQVMLEYSTGIVALIPPQSSGSHVPSSARIWKTGRST